MTHQEIIQADAQRGGDRTDWRETYATLMELQKQPQYRMLQANNSLFLYENRGDGSAFVWMFTADDVKELEASGDEFFKAMKVIGFKRIMFNTNRTFILKYLKMRGMKYTSDTAGPVDPISGSPMTSVTVEI